MQSIEAKNMVQHQVHTWDMLDKSLLLLMGHVDRQTFVHPDYHSVAYSEGAIKAVNGTVMLPAKEVARMLDALSIGQTDSVALVGPESGYVAALIAQLSEHVTWFLPKNIGEKTPVIDGVNCVHKDLLHEWQQDGPFDVVVILGAVQKVLPSFFAALRVNGRLWAVVAKDDKLMTATCFIHKGQQNDSPRTLYETRWPFLPGAHLNAGFSL